MQILFLFIGFFTGAILSFFAFRARSAAERTELESLKARLAASETQNEEREAACIAAAKASAALETFEKQAGREKELLAEAHKRELDALRERYGKEQDSLRENFQNELAVQQKLADERMAAQERAFATERDALKKNFSLLEQQFRENRQEMEKNWQTKIDLLKEEFKTLSSEILKEKSGHLADVNQNQLSALLKPLQEKLGDFKTAGGKNTVLFKLLKSSIKLFNVKIHVKIAVDKCFTVALIQQTFVHVIP